VFKNIGHRKKKYNGFTLGQVLLVCENKEQRIAHLTVVNDTVELLLGLVDALAVIRVNDKDKALRARVVVSP